MVKIVFIIALILSFSAAAGIGLCASTKPKATQSKNAGSSVCNESSPDFHVEGCEFEEQEQKKERADRELNKIYKTIISQLDSNSKSSLVAAQRLWVQFHVKDCEFQETLIEGGSPIMHSIAYSGCIEEHIKTRIKQLKAIFGAFGVSSK